MSTDIQRSEPRLIAAIQEQAAVALCDEAVARARLVAAELVGIVVTDAPTAARVTDQLAMVKDGKRAAKALLEGVTGPLRRAGDAARAAFAGPLNLLDQAEVAGKRALDGWDHEQRRRIQEERERLEQQAREAAEAQQAEGLEAPPMEAPPPAEPEPVYGNHAMSYATSTVRVELVDVLQVAKLHPELLKLDEVRAKALYRSLEGKLIVGPDGKVPLAGLLFWREKTRAIR